MAPKKKKTAQAKASVFSEGQIIRYRMENGFPHPYSPQIEDLASQTKWKERLRWNREFKLVRKLGEGGLGEVWEAETIAEGEAPTRLALKISTDGPGYVGAVAEFQNLFRLWVEMEKRGLPTSGIISLMGARGYDKETKRSFYPMPLLGSSLQAEIEASATGLSSDRVKRVGLTVLSIITHIHAAGFVHRDIKPDNIMVDAAGELAVRVKVIDYGEVSSNKEAHRRTIAGSPDFLTLFDGMIYNNGWLDIEAWILTLNYAYRRIVVTADAPDRNSFRYPRDSEDPRSFYRTANEPFASMMALVPRGSDDEAEDRTLGDDKSIPYHTFGLILAATPFAGDYQEI